MLNEVFERPIISFNLKSWSSKLFAFICIFTTSGCGTKAPSWEEVRMSNHSRDQTELTGPCKINMDELGECEERFLMVLPVDGAPGFTMSVDSRNSRTVYVKFNSEETARQIRDLASGILAGQEPAFIAHKIQCTGKGRWESTTKDEDWRFLARSMRCTPVA
jgi:hypothetical protein